MPWRGSWVDSVANRRPMMAPMCHDATSRCNVRVFKHLRGQLRKLRASFDLDKTGRTAHASLGIGQFSPPIEADVPRGPKKGGGRGYSGYPRPPHAQAADGLLGCGSRSLLRALVPLARLSDPSEQLAARAPTGCGLLAIARLRGMVGHHSCRIVVALLSVMVP